MAVNFGTQENDYWGINIEHRLTNDDLRSKDTSKI